jgi:hypothetical protein
LGALIILAEEVWIWDEMAFLDKAMYFFNALLYSDE